MPEKHSCDEVLAEVQRFLDHELPASEWDTIEQHIDSCTPCGDRVEFKRRLREIVASKCAREAVPDTLRGRIKALVAEESSEGR